MIPSRVIDYLESLYKNNWEIALITGRIYSFAKHEIGAFRFPFLLGVQNGADILRMPDVEKCRRFYLSREDIRKIVSLNNGAPSDCFIYAGFDHGDFCYYVEENFTPQMRKYRPKIEALSHKPWQRLDSWKALPVSEAPLVKLMGTFEELTQIAEALSHTPFTKSLIQDPFSERSMLMFTHPKARKGECAKIIKEELGISGPWIAAGDDRNDISMIRDSDVGIAMGNAPEDVKEVAQVIAPPASEKGIIQGIEEAMKQC